MAWISVHEKVIGSKLRSLSKEIGCSQNEALGMLVRLWLWGINNARKDGCICGANEDDLEEILSIGIDKKCDAKVAVKAIVKTGWIDIENGLYIHDWDEWQEQWYKAIEVRERDAARKREERRIKRLSKLQEKEDCIPEDKASDQHDESMLPTSRLNKFQIENIKRMHYSSSSYSKDFEEFWKSYPRKVGKAETYKKYCARLKDGWSESELLQAARNYSSKVIREMTEEKYVKHGKTFLSENTPFTDFIDKSEDDTASMHTETSNNDYDPYADWR